MKTELFEKMIRKIIREELEFYNSKLINEINQVNVKTQKTQANTVSAKMDKSNHGLSNALQESLSKFKQELSSEYNEEFQIGDDSMSFGNVQIPDELKSVFNRDYSELMKKFK